MPGQRKPPFAAQRALVADESWPAQTSPLSIRMALHTGEVELQAGGYHGPALHRGARMLTAIASPSMRSSCILRALSRVSR